MDPSFRWDDGFSRIPGVEERATGGLMVTIRFQSDPTDVEGDVILAVVADLR